MSGRGVKFFILIEDNFKTDNVGLNVAIDDCWDLTDDLRFMIEAYHQAFEFVQQHNHTAIFYQYALCYGRISGFQIFIQSDTELEEFIHRSLNEWTQNKILKTTNGTITELATLPYFSKSVKNLTVNNLKQALNREYRFMYDQLVDFANTIGFGLVNCSGTIDYISDIRKFSARRQTVSACI